MRSTRSSGRRTGKCISQEVPTCHQESRWNDPTAPKVPALGEDQEENSHEDSGQPHERCQNSQCFYARLHLRRSKAHCVRGRDETECARTDNSHCSVKASKLQECLSLASACLIIAGWYLGLANTGFYWLVCSTRPPRALRSHLQQLITHQGDSNRTLGHRDRHNCPLLTKKICGSCNSAGHMPSESARLFRPAG